MGGLTSGHQGTSPRPSARRRRFPVWALGAVSKAVPPRPAIVPLLLLALFLLPTPSSQQQGHILYINNADPTCQGQTLNAVGTTAAGDTGSHTIALTVTPAPEPAPTLHATPTSGVAPLTVIFSLLGGPVPASLTLDLEGDGTPEFTGPTLDGQTFSYPTPGLYLPTVTVTDAQGQLQTGSAVVQVYNPTILEEFLQAKWQGMKDAFRRGDTEGALQGVAVGIRSRYRPAFLALRGDLPVFADTLGDLQILSFQDGLAEAATVRLEDGQRRVYFIYFVPDEDGIWRILGM